MTESHSQSETDLSIGENRKEKVDLLIQISHAKRVDNVPQSIRLAKEALDLSDHLNYKKGYADSECHLGLYYMILGANDKALQYSQSALWYYEGEGDLAGAAMALYNIGSIKYKTANHVEGLDYLLRCLKLMQRTGDQPGESKTLKAIGYIYETFRDYDNALETYLKCRKISQAINDKNGESNACNPLSGIYLKRNDIKNALETIDTSIRLKEETGDKRGLAFAFFGKAKVYHKLGLYPKAQHYYAKSMDIHKEMGEQLGLGMCQNKLGILFLDQNKLTKACKFLEDALKTGLKIGNKDIMFKAYYHLYLIAKKQGDSARALEYHEQYHNLQEQVLNLETSGRIKSQQMVHKARMVAKEAELQRRENQMLEQQNRIIETKNDELDGLNRELKEANTTKDKFFSILGHDLKDPLNALSGLAKILAENYEDYNDEDRVEFLHNIGKASDQLRKLTQNLLVWAQLQSNEFELNLEPVDLHQVVSDNLDLMKYQAASKSIKLSANIPPGSIVMADNNMANTVIRNLLSNAIKFTPQEGEVDIHCHMEEDGKVQVCVHDTGVGMAQEQIDKLFKIQEKVSTRGTANERGTGLGLILCKEFIEKNGGKLWVESQEGEGSKFCFSLLAN